MAGADCCVFVVCCTTDLLLVPPRVATIESVMEVSMNRIAEIVVAFESTVAEPRGPNAVCEPMPPKAPARSAALPLCSNTTITKNAQTRTCTMVRIINIFFAF